MNFCSSKRSDPTFCHRYSGNLDDSIGSLWRIRCCKHVGQFCIRWLYIRRYLQFPDWRMSPPSASLDFLMASMYFYLCLLLKSDWNNNTLVVKKMSITDSKCFLYHPVWSSLRSYWCLDGQLFKWCCTTWKHTEFYDWADL